LQVEASVSGVVVALQVFALGSSHDFVQVSHPGFSAMAEAFQTSAFEFGLIEEEMARVDQRLEDPVS
jgi:hypothetical protein